MDEPLHAEELEAVLLRQTVEIVSAYVAKNTVALPDLCGLIYAVHESLSSLTQSTAIEAPNQTAATSIKKSIRPDYLVCLEDGKRVKMLKRYLWTNFGMTPTEYRTKWGLPPDYPMAAPNYTRARSDFARLVGFGTKNSRQSGVGASFKFPG